MPVGPSLPPYDHYARHIKKKWIATDPQSGDVVVDKDAFKPRKYDDGTVEDTISGNHVEKFAGEGLSAEVAALEVHIRSIGRTLKKNEAFAVGQVGAIIDAGAGEGAALEVREDQTPEDHTHAVITGIEFDADLVQAAVARETTVFRMTSF